jgi:hypothetical protein
MNNSIKTIIIPIIILLFIFNVKAALKAPAKLSAKPGHLRISLRWQSEGAKNIVYEVERSSSSSGSFRRLNKEYLRWPVYCDFTGKTASRYYYRVRAVKLKKKKVQTVSPWSRVISGYSRRSTATQFLTEIQEASFSYFYDFAHPVSGLSREGSHRGYDLCAIGVTGFGLFNLGVGVERKFITRVQGTDRALKILRFLNNKAQRYYGAFPHWINGTTGKVIKFGKKQDGIDIVETAFLAQGLLFLREYFSRNTSAEKELRRLANKLWREIQWNRFVKDDTLMWNWSPNSKWDVLKLKVTGFNECQIAYILALASPTYSIKLEIYWKGWYSQNYGSTRKKYQTTLYLSKDYGSPLFFTHYSYLGLDPRQLAYKGKSYFEHFRDLALVQKRYAEDNPGKFKDYGRLWGLTASMGPDGYRAHRPGKKDNGTITPTAALSSMPYVPNDSKAFMKYLFFKYKAQIWGDFGFFDALNPSRDYFPRKYLGLDVGTITPMIENYRTGLCWKRFMQAPEIKKTVKLLKQTQPKDLQ